MKRLLSALAAGLAALVLAAPALSSDLDLEVIQTPAWPADGLPVWNVYWNGAGWRTPFLLAGGIDQKTSDVLHTQYGLNLRQYQVPALEYRGSVEAVEPCASQLTDTVDTLAVAGFLACQLRNDSRLPARVRTTLTGTAIFNVFLPPGVTAVQGAGPLAIARSCTDFHGYHFFDPFAGNRPLIFTILPLECRQDVDPALALVTHELVEAATDPIPGAFWIDFSSGIAEMFEKGEVADICGAHHPEHPAQQAFTHVRYAGTTVASYWSNAHDACVIADKRVVYSSFTSNTAGASVTLAEGTERVAYSEALLEGASYDFAPPDAGAGTRYVESDSCHGVVVFPADDPGLADASRTFTCNYQRQFLVGFEQSGLPAGAFWTLTVNGVPYAGPASVWINEGDNVHFSYGAVDGCTLSSPGSPVTISAPLTVRAIYACITTYADLVRSDGPIGYWRLGGEGRLVAVDSSGHGLDGTYEAGVTGSPGAIAGDADEAAHFSGTGVVVPAYAALNLAGPVTVEAWVRSTGPGSFGYVVAKSDFHGTLGYALYTGGSATLRFFVGMGSSRITPDLAFVWNGAWHHVVGEYDGASVRLYADKVLVASAPASGPIADSAARLLTIGRYNDGGFAFSGDIDEVAVYGYALSEDQIHAHYNKGVFG